VGILELQQWMKYENIQRYWFRHNPMYKYEYRQINYRK
jgi:hypothetical protein